MTMAVNSIQMPSWPLEIGKDPPYSPEPPSRPPSPGKLGGGGTVPRPDFSAVTTGIKAKFGIRNSELGNRFLNSEIRIPNSPLVFRRNDRGYGLRHEVLFLAGDAEIKGPAVYCR